MSGVATLAVTVAAAAGAVAAYRFFERRKRAFKKIFDDAAMRAETKGAKAKIIDYERDPESGVYRPKP